MARHNVSDVNRINGIVVLVGSASHNVATRNGSDGLALGGAASYFGNTLNGNNNEAVEGGVNLGQNLCNNAVCPGARF